MLGGNVLKKIVEELVILPAISGSNFASIRMDLLPLERNIFGTIHSHPSYSNNPSNGDLQTFLNPMNSTGFNQWHEWNSLSVKNLSMPPNLFGGS